MKLTPLDIRKQEFRRSWRGFDMVEVQTFLEMIAEEYEKIIEENKELHRRQIELETKLQDYQETEKTLKETLVNVQEVKKQSEESSKRQADLIVKEAELKAIEIMEKAKKQARQMREEVSWLQSQKESFINRLRHILISQIELLSVMEIDDAIPEQAQELLKSVKSRKLAQARAARQKAREAGESETAPEEESSNGAESESILLAESKGEGENPGEFGHLEGEEENKLAEAKKAVDSQAQLSEEDINEFFKKGIQIDELIKTLNKKEKER